MHFVDLIAAHCAVTNLQAVYVRIDARTRDDVTHGAITDVFNKNTFLATYYDKTKFWHDEGVVMLFPLNMELASVVNNIEEDGYLNDVSVYACLYGPTGPITENT